MCKTGRKLDETQPTEQVVARQTKRTSRKNKEPEIDWNTWWPFTRATGTALRQLNRKQVKRNTLNEIPEALL